MPILKQEDMKDILNDYEEVKQEIVQLEKRIQDDEEELEELYNNSYLMTGETQSRYDVVVSQLEKKKFILECRKNKLLEHEVAAEEFISELPTAMARRVATMRYIEGMKWDDVARAECKKTASLKTKYLAIERKTIALYTKKQKIERLKEDSDKRYYSGNS